MPWLVLMLAAANVCFWTASWLDGWSAGPEPRPLKIKALCVIGAALCLAAFVSGPWLCER